MRSIALMFAFVLAVLATLAIAVRPGDDNEMQGISQTLDALHDAASKADGDRYFALFAPDAVFLGTDATERWLIEEFRAYAMKRFATGQGWTYHLKNDQRHISVAADGSFAWFDELLENAKYGTCRASGVLRRMNGQWKIVQYNLSIPIPNELAADVVQIINRKPAAQP